MRNNLILILTLSLLITSCGKKDEKSLLKKPGTKSIDTISVKLAEEAFIFTLPLAMMEITKRKFTNYEVPSELGAPINQFSNKNEFPDFKFRKYALPNTDTYSSSAFCDVTNDAIVLSLPATNGRYYFMSALDAYSNVFFSPGTRTTGNNAGNYLITGPKWSGTVPAGIKEHIKSPTVIFWLLGYFQVNSKEDGESFVIPIQNKLKITPLTSWGKEYSPPQGKIDPTVSKEDPNTIIRYIRIDEYFQFVNKLMEENPPKSEDKAAMNLFAKIGVIPGEKFDVNKFNSETLAEMKNIPSKVFNTFYEELLKPKQLQNGWNIMMKGMGSYGTDYDLRALVAYAGLGANLSEDAVYPSCNRDSEGNPFTGEKSYQIHFDKGETPPVNAFWSLTMYNKQGHFIENPLNIYSVGQGSQLKYNIDGSLDIYIQNLSPGKNKESNWLPSPEGEFNLILRMYQPKEIILDGSWIPPSVKKQ